MTANTHKLMLVGLVVSALLLVVGWLPPGLLDIEPGPGPGPTYTEPPAHLTTTAAAIEKALTGHAQADQVAAYYAAMADRLEADGQQAEPAMDDTEVFAEFHKYSLACRFRHGWTPAPGLTAATDQAFRAAGLDPDPAQPFDRAAAVAACRAIAWGAHQAATKGGP